MAYRPLRHPEFYQGMGPPWQERIPPAGTARKEKFIHFDIDPTNSELLSPNREAERTCVADFDPVLVGENTPESAHPLIPVMKMPTLALDITSRDVISGTSRSLTGTQKEIV